MQLNATVSFLSLRFLNCLRTLLLTPIPPLPLFGYAHAVYWVQHLSWVVSSRFLNNPLRLPLFADEASAQPIPKLLYLLSTGERLNTLVLQG
ncbi:MAG: hypothetical protein AAFX78_12355 [Cyanobacteria bacterium J06638_20]